jgi:hypothetical protein
MYFIKILCILSLTILSKSKIILSQNSLTSNYYSRINEFNNLFEFDQSNLLNSFDSNSILNCFISCTKTSKCHYIVYQNKKCFIGDINLIRFVNYDVDGTCLIYEKKLNVTDNLINYWAFNGNVNDSIRNAHLFGGVNANLTLDRFGKANSALRLINGYYRVPSGVYFSGTQFTIMSWVNVRGFNSYSRLIDFGNGANNDNVVLALSRRVSGQPYFSFNSGPDNFNNYALDLLTLNKWQHLTLVFSFPFYSLYIDGNEARLLDSTKLFGSLSLANVVRTSNFIGKSNGNDPFANADFDDLKIYNRALSPTEIQNEMNNNL